MKIKAVLSILIAVFSISCNNQNKPGNALPVTYCIDSEKGDDNNSGTSRLAPWKSIEKLSDIMLSPGDSVLLRGGMTFRGSIRLRDLHGTPSHPVVISSYGGKTARIESGDSAAIFAAACSSLRIERLEVIGSGRLSGNVTNGIELAGCTASSLDSIIAHGYLYSGIRITGGKNISITASRCYENGFCGINVESGEAEYGPDGSAYKTMHGLYIGRCVAHDNPGCPAIKDNHSGNGILVGGVTGGVIEHCEAMNNGWDMPREGNGPVGIWAYMSDSIVIRYCYSHHNKTSPKGKDGGGFDFDGGVRYSVMQYNLSAFNEGAGYGIFQYGGATEWCGNIMKYNISYHDGSKNGQCGILVWCDPTGGPMHTFKASENTIVNKYGYGVGFEPGAYRDFIFENNVFLLPDTSSIYTSGKWSLALFRNNRYLGLTDGNQLPEAAYLNDGKTKLEY